MTVRCQMSIMNREPTRKKPMELVLKLLAGGAGSLAAYLAAHVLLCLLPAFFIAAPWQP
ncbi:hypothetical protein Y695_01472 [Hydrogenophaga sp. T4]|nr:hypothetical protein Y695_01472 [Hydrogenophaga sp. T4]